MAELKQLTSYVREFLMIQSSDHITGLTAASPTLNLSMAGAAFASTNAVIAEVGNGFYKASLTSTDTRTLGELAFHFTATSADPTDFIDQVRANILGDTLPANVTQWNSSNVSAPQTAGVPDVNVRNIANASVSTTTTQLGVNVVNIGAAASQGAAGYVGIDWAKINAPTTAQALAQTTINSSQSVITSAPVTVGTNNDKTGYSLTQAFPANFAALAILAGGQVGIDWGNIAKTASTNILSGTTINTSQSTLSGGIVGTVAANVTQWNGAAISAPQTAGVPDVNIRNIANAPVSTNSTQLGVNTVTNSDKTGYALSQAFPSNFSALGILAGGQVGIDWGNVANKTTVNALTQTTINSSQSVITTAPVTVGTNNDKTGYALTSGERTSIATAAWTTAQSESYSALHVNPTPIQLLYQSRAFWEEKSVSGTSVSVLQIDGATLAMAFTLDSTSPTKISRAA